MTASEAPSGVWYHVTYLHAVPSIQEEGLLPQRGGSFARFGGFAGHSKGGVFFTEWSGVPYWHGRLEAVQSDQSDNSVEDGWTPVVLAVDFDNTSFDVSYEEDVQGSRESHARAIKVKTPIPAEDLWVWDGTEWVTLEEFDPEAAQETAMEAATIEEVEADEESDEEDYTVVWPGEDVFLPSEPYT